VYLILDRDPLYTTAFRRLLKDKGEACNLPARSPNLKVYCERWIPAKSEVLDRMVLLGERHLRRLESWFPLSS
jgi:hypothetical protein